MIRRSRFDGTSGRPRSANGASSFHLLWDAPAGPWASVGVTLTVTEAPQVDRLWFWALQVGFVDRGRRGGAAHLGLQWHPAHPGRTAVNWGGYDADGRELGGSLSPLPSATGNPNTRDLAWRPGVAHELQVVRGVRGWVGSVAVAGEAPVEVRELWAPGTDLDSPMVWSEVFADCDDPPAEVRWSDAWVAGADGVRREVWRAHVRYQAVADGGCSTTDSSVEDGSWVQRSGTTRRHRERQVLDRRISPQG